jgi:pyruvate kinase
VLHRLLEHGVNVVRFNMSHGTIKDHENTFKMVKRAAAAQGLIVATMADIRGPKIRTGLLDGGKAILTEGSKIVLTTRQVTGNSTLIPIDYPKFSRMVHPESKVYLADGALELDVVKVEGEDAQCTVMIGGELGNRKGVNVPHIALDLPALSQKDLVDIEFAVKMGFDFIAQSYVRNKENVMELRALLEKMGSPAHIIAKIEDAQGFHNLKDIVAVADAVMVARGDLGVQLPLEDIPMIQKTLVAECRAASKPVIIATQMLDSMIRNPSPTRAEVSDVANGVVDGADALMLSGETASGSYPVKVIQVMDRIIRKAEGSMFKYDLMKDFDSNARLSIQESIAKSVCYTARDLRANAIVAYTLKGHTPRYIAKYRPFAPLIAATCDKGELAQLQLIWGMHPVLIGKPKNTEDAVTKCAAEAEKKQLAGSGDVLVITAGIPLDLPENTNFMKVHVV